MRWHRRVKTTALVRSADGDYRGQMVVDYIRPGEGVVHRRHYPRLNYSKMVAEADWSFS